MADPASWAMAGAMLVSAGASTYSAIEGHEAQKETMRIQQEAQNEALLAQQEADKSAEKQRLEALAANQKTTDYGNIWGADSAKYADAAQKLSAGTGSFNTDEDETNPFYQRGLL